MNCNNKDHDYLDPFEGRVWLNMMSSTNPSAHLPSLRDSHQWGPASTLKVLAKCAVVHQAKHGCYSCLHQAKEVVQAKQMLRDDRYRVEEAEWASRASRLSPPCILPCRWSLGSLEALGALGGAWHCSLKAYGRLHSSFDWKAWQGQGLHLSQKLRAGRRKLRV